ncbi:MAG: phosphonoacetaldehyde hydrolase [Planctomycetales bacterium]|nr:phosphonoacetaldehyde hydrolase [Planctomycetales bacterium]MCA9164344.1 phosphonoacetaldehyde hydrolase [Planctomycetales bacterium]MCB9922010.1 phosphonoacetaldehyde hydrolase [Planctomycetaceae bacterium]
MATSRFRAVIFDWAGTTVDYGSCAPARAFVEVFRSRGVDISEREARAPMGLSKREHIAAIADMPRVAELWQDTRGELPTDADVQSMYDDFLPLQIAALANHSDVIPGVADAVAECRRLGMKIGSTTGYTRELMQVVMPLAASEGYTPDAIICSDDVAAGRPAPWMNFRAAEELGIYPMDSVLVVDDTPVGIVAGRNAGASTIAITQTGNALGLTRAEIDNLLPDELESRLDAAGRQFQEAGADYLLRSVAELPQLLGKLDSK